jgi:hypothetical protein
LYFFDKVEVKWLGIAGLEPDIGGSTLVLLLLHSLFLEKLFEVVDGFVLFDFGELD